MKRIYLLLAMPVLLTSCAGGWQAEDKEKLRKECLLQAEQQVGDATGKGYCDCFVESVVKSYPVFNDFMENRNADTLEKLKARCRHENGLQ